MKTGSKKTNSNKKHRCIELENQTQYIAHLINCPEDDVPIALAKMLDGLDCVENYALILHDKDFDDKVMLDYSAGEISSEESLVLMEAVKEALEDEGHGSALGVHDQLAFLGLEGGNLSGCFPHLVYNLERTVPQLHAGGSQSGADDRDVHETA